MAIHDSQSTDQTVAHRVLGLIDLTDLTSDCSPEAIDELCRRAQGPFGSTAAVCVWPLFVAQSATLLAHSGVQVATVVNFPHGGNDITATVAETSRALSDGATEIDMVLPFHAFLAGRTTEVSAMVAAVRRETHSPAVLKVILEAGSYPSLDLIKSATTLAIGEGADFVKTSTGKTNVSATIAAAVMILDAIRTSGRTVGLKASGGIRTVGDASHYLAVADQMMGPDWVSVSTFRFGASGLLDDVEDALGNEPVS